MSRRRVKPLLLEELLALSTLRLRAYRRRLHSLEENVSTSDLDPTEWAALDLSYLHSKDDDRWGVLQRAIAVELAQRGAAGR